MTHTLEPIALPADHAGWMEFVTTRPKQFLEDAKAHLAELKDGSERSAADVVALIDEMHHSIARAGSTSYLVAESHPDEDVRAAAEERYVEASSFESALSVDRELFEALSAVDQTGLDAEQKRVIEHALRDLRLAGVALNDDQRARAQQLAERDTELSTEFGRNIRDGRLSMKVEPAALEGLPEDFIENHPVDEDGLVTITTEYPDLMPVREYAKNRETRVAITALQNQIAWPVNDAVLKELLNVRRERAHLLGFGNWSDVEVAPRMAKNSENVARFITEIDEASAPAAEPEYDRLLARLQQDDPLVEDVTTADLAYTLAAVKREEFDVDAQEVRAYFSFEKVLQGVLDLTGELFEIEYQPVDAASWHEDVHTYDVVASGTRIGRIHLDLHPRDGKYNHAACFDLATGKAGVELAEGVLLCNFARGLMEHDEVVTFLHEFGHLVHAILAGGQRFAVQSGISTEWDFVEAPSQMLEEWAWDANVLARFATNSNGEPIPADLVERMRTADAFGRALLVRRQLGLTQVSFRLHVDVPDDISAETQRLLESMSRVRSLPDSHLACSFGHLTGYGASYYTYQWSLVIARDLLTAFGDDLMNRDVALRYRDRVLARGGTADAADLISDFLGRPYNFDAYQSWLASDS